MIRTIYKCDMCGKEAEFYGHPTEFTAANYGWWIITHFATRMSHDFCSEKCAKDYVKHEEQRQ